MHIFRKSLGRFFLLAIALFMVLSSAYGEDFFSLKKRLVDSSRYRFAFLYINPYLTLENVGYTDNIYSYDNISRPDWTADIGLDLRVSSILGDRFIVVLRDKPFYSLYLENKNEEAFNNNLNVALHTYLGRLNLTFEAERSSYRQRPTREFGSRVRFTREGETVSIDYGKHTSFFVNLYAGVVRHRFEDDNYLGNPEYDLSRLLDREEMNAGVNVNKIVFSRTRMFLNYEYFSYSFTHSPDRNGDGSLVSLGFILPQIGLITGSIRVGYKFYSPRNPIYQEYSTPFGTGKVSVMLFRRLKLKFNYLLENYFSFYNPEQYYNDRTAGLGAEFYFTRAIKVGYDYHVGRMTFRNLVDGALRRTDNTSSSTVTLGIRLYKNFGIGVQYVRFQGESDEFNFSRSYEFIGGYVTHEF